MLFLFQPHLPLLIFLAHSKFRFFTFSAFNLLLLSKLNLFYLQILFLYLRQHGQFLFFLQSWNPFTLFFEPLLFLFFFFFKSCLCLSLFLLFLFLQTKLLLSQIFHHLKLADLFLKFICSSELWKFTFSLNRLLLYRLNLFPLKPLDLFHFLLSLCDLVHNLLLLFFYGLISLGLSIFDPFLSLFFALILS